MKPSHLPVWSALTLASWLSISAVPCAAIKLKIQGRRTPWTDLASSFEKRGTLKGSSPLNNSADISYLTNITMGGQQFEVLIDTGSADLWVAGSVPNAKDSGKTSGVTYAIGQVQGPVKFASLDFAGFTIPDQAYLEITPSKDNPAGTGLIGLGPVTGSNIYSVIPTNQGMTVLDNIFLQDRTTPNFLTILLGREDDPTDIFNGDISIGEVLGSGADDDTTHRSLNLSAITSQPQMKVTIVDKKNKGNQHFQILMDEDGFLGPDGLAIPAKTAVSSTKDSKQLTAVVDSGFSLSQVPKSVADAIYSRVTGSEFVNVTGIGATWIVPCFMEVNLTIKIGGVKYPVHPMDVTLNPAIVGLSNVHNKDGLKSCIGTFQPFSFDPGSSRTFDVILGMSFIRNVYALFDFGDFTGNGQEKGDPYIQFLSTTDPAEAHTDFVTVRLNGNDSTGDQVLGAPITPPPDSEDSGFQKFIDNVKDHKTIYLALGIAAVVLAFLLCVGSIYCCRRNKTRKNPSANFMGGQWGGGGYKPLDESGQGVPLNKMDSNHSYAPAGTGNYQYANANSGMGYGMGGTGFEQRQPLYDPPTAPTNAPPSYAPPPGPPQTHTYNNPFESSNPR